MDRKVIALIPARGGSKSIPLKNIKLFCGKPLLYWSLNALEHATAVDEIVVATDNELIALTALSFGFEKVKVFHRSSQNATDTASTESVMLEYIRMAHLMPFDVLMLLQATSPLTESIHFDEALTQFFENKYDSMLTCVRSFRFFWNADGTSKNYDYMNRPRRQDFDGDLMENGAFYINSVENIVQYRNRLSARIGIYEMPSYTAFEIDEPDDWVLMENLMSRHVLSNREYREIKLFLSDVDGVLTDGGMYYSEAGDELKKFNTRDGMGFQLLRQAGIKTGIMTSENTRIVERRASKLQIDYLYQGKKDGGKLQDALDICQKEGITLKQVAYIGDDVNCFELLSQVGVAACPADAVDKIKSIPGIQILNKIGGEGAVREFIELLLPEE
jgi:N-acylneuraminate cytidylyltransferase